MDMTKITSQYFAPSVGDVFVCKTLEGDFPLTLDNVKMLAISGRRDTSVLADGQEVPPRDPFALTFEGPVSPVLQQGIYILTSEKNGELEVFLSPFRQDQGCTLYESIFN